MAGLGNDIPAPTEIKLHQKSRVFEIAFDSGERFELPYEYLRVFTPSAEARGHGPGQEVLQVGKRDVTIERIEPVGNLRSSLFSATGTIVVSILGTCSITSAGHRDELWQTYLDRLRAEGKSRDPADNPPAPTPVKGGCGHHIELCP